MLGIHVVLRQTSSSSYNVCDGKRYNEKTILALANTVC